MQYFTGKQNNGSEQQAAAVEEVLIVWAKEKCRQGFI